MNVIQYPTEDPRDQIGRRLQADLDRQRARDQFRGTVAPQLRTLFQQINADAFGGQLPTPKIELAYTASPKIMGVCFYARQSWDEPFRIVLRPEVADGPRDEREAYMRHEIAHLAQWALGGKAGADEAAHGPVFRRMLDQIDDATGHRWVGVLRGVVGEPTTRTKPKTGPKTAAAPKKAAGTVTRISDRRTAEPVFYPDGWNPALMLRTAQTVRRVPARVATPGAGGVVVLVDERNRYLGWEKA